MSLPAPPLELAAAVALRLKETRTRIVFAESCTAGWCAALLSSVPGISEWLCGSFVTYQNQSKFRWLGVSEQDLNAPEIGPVSDTVARQMCVGALAFTPHADVAVSVTGHLGPQAPPELDGIVFIGVGQRSPGITQPIMTVERLQLPTEQIDPRELRLRRQQLVVATVYQQVLTLLSGH